MPSSGEDMPKRLRTHILALESGMDKLCPQSQLDQV